MDYSVGASHTFEFPVAINNNSDQLIELQYNIGAMRYIIWRGFTHSKNSSVKAKCVGGDLFLKLSFGKKDPIWNGDGLKIEPPKGLNLLTIAKGPCKIISKGHNIKKSFECEAKPDALYLYDPVNLTEYLDPNNMNKIIELKLSQIFKCPSLKTDISGFSVTVFDNIGRVNHYSDYFSRRTVGEHDSGAGNLLSMMMLIWLILLN